MHIKNIKNDLNNQLILTKYNNTISKHIVTIITFLTVLLFPLNSLHV